MPKKTETGTGTDLTTEQVQEVVKKKRTRPDRTAALTPTYEKGEVAQMIKDALTLSKMGKVDMHDPDAVERRVDEALMYMIEHDMKPTIESIALAFGTNRTTFWRWREGVESDLPEASRNAIKRAYTITNQLLTQTMVNGKINPIPAIFLLKNNFEYRDQTDVVVTPNNPMQGLDPMEARQRVLDALPEGDED
jgi:hypothetical protein